VSEGTEGVMDDESGESIEEEVSFMGKGALESKRLVMRLTKRRGEAYTERNDLVKRFGNLSLLTTVSDGQKTRSVLEPESVC